MNSTFPRSYPYLNPNGVLIEKREVEEVARGIFRYFGPKSREYGVELARVINWVMRKLTCKTGFYRLTARLFARSMRQNESRQYSNLIKRLNKLNDPVYAASFSLETEEDHLFTYEERLLIKEDFNKLAAITMPLEEIIQADRVKRFREIRKIREILRRLEGVKSN